MRLLVQDPTRLRLATPAHALSLSVFEDVVLAHLAEHYVAEIVRDMSGTEQSTWMAANEMNQRAAIQERLRSAKRSLIGELHAQGVEPINAAQAVVKSRC